MKPFKILGLAITVIFIISCSSKGDDVEENDRSFGEKVIRGILYPFRSGEPSFLSEKQKQAKDLYNAVHGTRIEWIQELLETGVDPNYCRGVAGWLDSNPLNVVSESFYNTYYQRKRGDTVPDPVPDVLAFFLLIQAGADINRRPYVWNRVYNWNNKHFDSIRRQRKANNESIEPEDMKEQINNFVEDSNRLLEVFLLTGADPDIKGHPYPYSYEAMKARITDEQAKEYFSKGSRAINIAIEKGFVWESQVDLLLEYTELDEESLKAARRSNDPEMVDKINELWEEQQKKNN